MNNDNYLLSSVSNALRILDLLAKEDMLSVAQISSKLSMSKTSAFRYLCTLEAGGYVHKTPDARYMLGMKFVYMANVVQERRNGLVIVNPLLSELRDRLNETVHLSVLQPDLNTMFVAKLTGTRPLQMRTHIGQQVPAYISASGRILLSFLLGTEREKELGMIRFDKQTSLSLADPEALLRELDLIREQGYAEQHGELEDGLSGMAVPIVNREHIAVASVSVCGLSLRLQENREEYLDALFETKEKIERTLGMDQRIE